MVFSSSVFLFLFLPLALLIYHAVRPELRNIVLLAVSLLFYAWGEPKNIFLMLLSILVNYFLGLIIEKNRGKFSSKAALIFSVLYNIGMLFGFKYLNFAADILNSAFSANIQLEQIALPIGISFYTFQILSYVVDVYKGDVKAQKNILSLALYIALFPQLIAGPIVRYIDIEKQIHCRSVSSDDLCEGIRRFTVGFSKKVLLADQLAPLVTTVFKGTYPSFFSNWIGIIAYSLQIYYDFSGYSDMAIGIGRMFGFSFSENFNFPYISQSVQEFWRRWHISLSSWFRDYVYIPLGGSRKGKFRTYLNLIIVFFLTGLWHGASYNFIVWGLFYAVFLVIERLGFNKTLEKAPKFLRHMYTLIVILIGWVFFRADDLTSALKYIGGMFTLSGNDVNNFIFIMDRQNLFCIIAGIFFAMPHNKIKEFSCASKTRVQITDMVYILIFAFAVCCMIGSGYSPFLYFRF